MTIATKVLFALIAGLTIGIAIQSQGNASLAQIPRWLEPLGALWVNAIRMTVIPLVVSAIVLGINALPDSRSVGRLAARALLFFALVLTFASSTGAIVGRVTMAKLAIDPAATVALRASVEQGNSDALKGAEKIVGFGQWLVDLVPTNPIKAAADGAMLPLIVFTLLFGLAVSQLVPDNREPLVGVVRAVNTASLTLVRWILAVAPLGVFAIAVPLAMKLGIAAVGAVAYYVLIVCLLNILLMLLLYGAAFFVGKQPLRLFARAVAPAQAVAFSSRSSLASLPALLQGADVVLRLPVAVRSFVLPFAVAMFRPGGAILLPVGVFFVARLYGVELTPLQTVSMVIASIVTTFSAPGVPGGSVLVMVPVLLAVGLPVGGVGLLLGVDTVPDMFRTVTNVTGDMAAASVINRFEEAHVVSHSEPAENP